MHINFSSAYLHLGIIFIFFAAVFLAINFYKNSKSLELVGELLYLPAGFSVIGVVFMFAWHSKMSYLRYENIKYHAEQSKIGECHSDGPIYNIRNELEELNIDCKNYRIRLDGTDAEVYLEYIRKKPQDNE